MEGREILNQETAHFPTGELRSGQISASGVCAAQARVSAKALLGGSSPVVTGGWSQAGLAQRDLLTLRGLSLATPIPQLSGLFLTKAPV